MRRTKNEMNRERILFGLSVCWRLKELSGVARSNCGFVDSLFKSDTWHDH